MLETRRKTKELTIWMLESEFNLPTTLCSKRFLSIMVREFRIVTHSPVV